MSGLADDRASLAASPDRWALMAVLALWVGLIGIISGCIALYGRNLPLSEDWEMVPAITGHEPKLLAWLWTQVNEHRVPLQKAVYLLLLKASGGDFRIGGIANTIILGGLALAMILTARQLRGCTRRADGFLPLALLHPGNLVNFVFGFQIQLVVSTALIVLWLLIMVRARWPLSPRTAVAACTILLLLPLSGANGFLFTPFVALWLVLGAHLYQTTTSAAWIAQFRRACVIISIVLVGVSFVGHSSQVTPPYAGFGATVITGIRFVGMGIGEIGAGKASSQLISGNLPHLATGGFFCGAVLLLLASCIVPLRSRLREIRTPDGSQVFGFLMFGAAMALLVVVVAYGRAGWVPLFGMPDRYTLLSAPALCAAYFVWLLYGTAPLRNYIANAFAVVAVLALPFNVREGAAWRDYYLWVMHGFESDLSINVSWHDLAVRNRDIAVIDADTLADRLRMLHDAKLGPVGRL